METSHLVIIDDYVIGYIFLLFITNKLIHKGESFGHDSINSTNIFPYYLPHKETYLWRSNWSPNWEEKRVKLPKKKKKTEKHHFSGHSHQTIPRVCLNSVVA